MISERRVQVADFFARCADFSVGVLLTTTRVTTCASSVAAGAFVALGVLASSRAADAVPDAEFGGGGKSGNAFRTATEEIVARAGRSLASAPERMMLSTALVASAVAATNPADPPAPNATSKSHSFRPGLPMPKL